MCITTRRALGEECLFAVARNNLPAVAMLHEAWLICAQMMLLRSPQSDACSGPSPARCLECVYSYYDGSHLRAMLKLPWRLAKLGAYPAYRLRRRALARRTLAGATGYSQFITDAHSAHLAGRVEFIPLGINLSGHAGQESPGRRKTPRFGFVAGFQQTKGIWHVLDAARALKREGFDFELHIWGPEQESGRGDIESRDLTDRVFLRGMYQPEDIWDVYADVDVVRMATTVASRSAGCRSKRRPLKSLRLRRR